MATLVICDRCKRDGNHAIAHYRVTFESLGNGADMLDHPIDLCKSHYERIWDGL